MCENLCQTPGTQAKYDPGPANLSEQSVREMHTQTPEQMHIWDCLQSVR